MFFSKAPWHSHLLLSVWNGAVTTCFKDSGLSLPGIERRCPACKANALPLIICGDLIFFNVEHNVVNMLDNYVNMHLVYVECQHKNMYVACWQKQVACEQNYVGCWHNSFWKYTVHSLNILHRTGLFWLQFIVITTIWIYIKIIDYTEYIYVPVYISVSCKNIFKNRLQI